MMTIRLTLLLTLNLGLARPPAAWSATSMTADVVSYGGTPGGLAAAAAAVREGVSVMVAEPTSHIGGMVTGGIATTDTGTPQLVGGISAEFFNAVREETQKSNASFAP